VMPEVQSVVTHGGMLIPRSEFTRVAAPEGFETNLSAINKGRRYGVTYAGSVVPVLFVALALGLVSLAGAAGLGKVAGRAAISRLVAKEVARDAATPAIALKRVIVLPRYATRQEAAAEAQQGLRAGQHLVGPTESKAILPADAASERYGLQHKTPEVRELWRVPKGTPARVNPVWGGARDATETTLTSPLPPQHLMRRCRPGRRYGCRSGCRVSVR